MRNDDPLLTISEAAVLADVSEWTLHSHRRFGELIAIRLGPRRFRIRKSELRRWMAARDADLAELVAARAERRREKAERYERWLRSQGLMRIPQCAET
jgi:excisionase family DNA binding protein